MLGPRRVPGAGPHPGSVAWGGPATTSPLPAFGSEVAEAELAADAAERMESVPSSHQAGASFAEEPAPVYDLSGPTVDFASAPQAGSPAQPGTGSQAIFAGMPVGGETSAGAVVVPPAEHVAHDNRLPIFEAVESDWFRRGRSGMPAAGVGGQAGLGGPTGPVSHDSIGGRGVSRGGTGGSWTGDQATIRAEPEVTWAASAADEGWHAAAAASSPATGGTTTAGLPKRVPQANLVPGTASPEPAAAVPVRSAAATRDRFASFQRGIREGRAAASGDEGDSDKDDGSR